MSKGGSSWAQPISKTLESAAVFFARYRALRPIALLFAALHKSYHVKLVDARAEREEAAKELGSWWLSFVDPERPDGQRFLGAAIVEGYGAASASIRAHELRVNPGGSVQAVELKGDGVPPPGLRNRLLSMNEIKEADLV
jgi:hypothetical protein